MTKSKAKSIEETYQKLEQREHILLRPGMYIGSTKKVIEELWVCKEDELKMTKKMVEYSPGLLKIMDEALTNAIDHSVRDTTVTAIKIDYDKKTGEISVWNNGTGVPIVLHKEHNMYVPELIFGHLLSGSNYNDKESRIIGGMNGIGIKAVNIFSKKLAIETVDSENKKKFIQEYTDNMLHRSKPKITSCSVKSYTKITFLPDYKRFDMKELETDTILLIRKRVFDCIAVTHPGISIYLNGEKLKGKGLLDYYKYFFDGEKIIHECHSNDKGMIWEYAVVPSPFNQFEQISFVNGIDTRMGGKHVDYIIYQITTKLAKMLETKKKLKDLKPSFIKDKLCLFLRATVVNPTFNSQTKETLTTQSKDFGCNVQVSDKFIEKIYKSAITEEIVEFCKAKEITKLAKESDGRKTSKLYIPKLEDALWAGTAKSNECTLLLTEGDSAATFAKWGRSIVGPERYGIIPLKGKCVSDDTKIPLWNGDIKLAKDIKIGDILIGDDGKQRKVLTLYKGNGKMYKISQNRGESYKVNDDHILTLCIPDHKSIYWNHENYSWRTLYWDKIDKKIKALQIASQLKIKCLECDLMISKNCIKMHYKRRHKNVIYENDKYPNDVNMNDNLVIQARQRLENILKTVDDNNMIDISVNEYINVQKSLKRKLKGLRGECVNWEHKDVLLDPYVLGLWLGDGSSNGYAYACHKEYDPEIMDYLNEWCKNNDATFKKVQSTKCSYSISSINNFRDMGCAPLKKILSEYDLINNKHIPKEYLINSKEIRLKVLAGIIDTDGYVAKDGTIEISQTTKHKKLIDDIVYLSRSLGFYTYVSNKKTNYNYKHSGERAEAYRIKISGDTSIIPTLVPRKKCTSTNKYNIRNSTGQIKITPIEDGNYVGIGIDGNSRFVINDFTVTHNCLNVRDATISQLMNNEEINNLKQILGLKQDYEYTNTKELRYGRVMLLTDSDVDGAHIKSLFVNFIHTFWPSLIKMNPNFIQTLRTPIIKAIKNKKVIEFYTEQDYIKWKEMEKNTHTFQIRYFKGLGTSKKEDAQETFRRINELKLDYIYKDKKCDESILLAFDKDKNASKNASKKTKKDDNDDDDDTASQESQPSEKMKCTDLRKKWLSTYDKNVYVDMKQKSVSFQDLIHKELIHFSVYDNMRSIPSLCDGLKPSQRKILHYMLKKNIKKVIKVAQLSGYVSAETGYHHGEASLQGAIINMAQDFVGSNNINLLACDGNFGSKFQGGSDAASPRYIYTYLSPITFHIFNQYDSPLLTYLNDDNLPIEPEWFLPIIPMVLVNGCSGIGTGYSTYIPPYNPNDIVTNLLRVLDDKDPLEMMPYFRGFHGQVEKIDDTHYCTKGEWKRVTDTSITITELPVGAWVSVYKDFLESMIENAKTKSKDNKSKDNKRKPKFVLKDVINKTKDENDDICFVVEFKNKEDLDNLITSETLEKELKLIKSFSINNMYLFSEDLILSKYNNPNDILLDFFDIRLDYYVKRRNYIIKKLKHELLILESKMRFITEYISNKLDINKKSKNHVYALLEKNKYPKISDTNDEISGQNETSDESRDKSEGSYDYLTRMPIMSLTEERIEDLSRQCKNKRSELEAIESKTCKDLWRDDLMKLREFL